MRERGEKTKKKEEKKLRATCEQESETCERLCESKISAEGGHIQSFVDR